MGDEQPRLYTEFADWFHLLTAPDEYAEESSFFLRLFNEALGTPPRTLLELGSGCGNMASHYKHEVQTTLTDLSPEMLALSARLDPGIHWPALDEDISVDGLLAGRRSGESPRPLARWLAERGSAG